MVRDVQLRQAKSKTRAKWHPVGSRKGRNQCVNLLWSKYGANVVSHALAATGAEDCAALSLPILVGAGNAHSRRDDTVGLQHMYHFGILLKTQSSEVLGIKYKWKWQLIEQLITKWNSKNWHKKRGEKYIYIFKKCPEALQARQHSERGILLYYHTLAQQSNGLVLAVKHGGESVVIWACLNAKGQGEMATWMLGDIPKYCQTRNWRCTNRCTTIHNTLTFNNTAQRHIHFICMLCVLTGVLQCYICAKVGYNHSGTNDLVKQGRELRYWIFSAHFDRLLIHLCNTKIFVHPTAKSLQR